VCVFEPIYYCPDHGECPEGMRCVMACTDPCGTGDPTDPACDPMTCIGICVSG
jgi:hypothetical protein